MDEGDKSTASEYLRRHEALNKELSAFKNKKQEHSERDDVVESAFKKLKEFEDKVGDLKKKKSWINDE